MNSEKFPVRLKSIMEYYNLTSSSLADAINVQRSSISHLLSGRNKPSLDFVMKLLQEYPEVELYWLLNGKGEFPKKTIQSKHTPTTLFDEKSNSKKNENISEEFPTKNSALDFIQKTDKSDEIEKIIFFYKDGSFKSYKPN